MIWPPAGLHGKQALEGGLIDKLGYQEDAVKRAIELNADKFSDRNNVRVVKYTIPQGLLSTLTGRRLGPPIRGRPSAE